MMTELSLLEALSGVFGFISLISWVFVLVNLTPRCTASYHGSTEKDAIDRTSGATVGRKLPPEERGRNIACISFGLVFG